MAGTSEHEIEITEYSGGGPRAVQNAARFLVTTKSREAFWSAPALAALSAGREAGIVDVPSADKSGAKVTAVQTLREFRRRLNFA